PPAAGGCEGVERPGGCGAAETVRVAAPGGAVRSVIGMSGREYRSRDGMYEMSASDARALVKAGGFKPTLGSPTRGGYPCPCGFHSIFRRCSDRKSTRLNSSHVKISYAVFCLKK